MKIVVTDGYTLNAGDLNWNKIAGFGELVVHDRTPVELIAERCKDANIILTNKAPISADTLAKLDQLQMISVTATGYNIVDVAAAKQRGVVVSNVPGYGTASVAQHVFALLLEVTNHVGKNAGTTAEGKWQEAPDWCYTIAPVTELADKVFGVVGFGNIGQQAGRIAKAFGMKVIYHNRSKKDNDIGEARDLKNVFSESDFISLHCSLSADNEQFVNKKLLHTMKKSAVLINTARGQLINEQDLADALNEDVIAAAALDVLSKEPPLSTNPLLKAKNCIITPHNAWISKEARERIMNVTADNIDAFLNGKPIHVVS